MTQKEVFVGLNELMGVSDPVTSGGNDPSQQAVPVPEPFSAPVAFEGGTKKGEETQEETDDFNFTRKLLHGLAEKGQELLDLAVNEARTVPHPRNIEVATGVMKKLGELGKDLLDLHQQRQNVKSTRKHVEMQPSAHEGGAGHTQINNDNRVVIQVEGTTDDLLDRVIAAREQADRLQESRALVTANRQEAEAIDAEYTDVTSTPKS